MGTGQTIVLVDGEAPPPFVPSKRFSLALLVFFAFIVQYSQRVNLPIAIVCMVNRTKVADHQVLFNRSLSTTTLSTDFVMDLDPNVADLPTTMRPVITALQKRGYLSEKRFNWIELQQQILLGGYWAGYIFTQVPGTFFVLFAAHAK